ncbi:MAG: hypothetical protein QM763_20095 [Agriterribacter sp.]
MNENIPQQHLSDEIRHNNLAYTLFSWSKQKGIDPIMVKKVKAFIFMIIMVKNGLIFLPG